MNYSNLTLINSKDILPFIDNKNNIKISNYNTCDINRIRNIVHKNKSVYLKKDIYKTFKLERKKPENIKSLWNNLYEYAYQIPC